MQLRKLHRSGQTLLEAMVAIGVILAAVIGSATLIITSITSGRVSQNRVEAANFAREGIEVYRSFRDNNYLKFQQGADSPDAAPSWNTGAQFSAGAKRITLGKSVNAITGTRFTWSVAACTSAPCSTPITVGKCTSVLQGTGIYKVTETATGRVFYSQYQSAANCSSSGLTCVATKYYRTINLSYGTDDINNDGDTLDPEDSYLNIQSTVRWNDRTGCKSLVAESRLYDWK